LFVLYRALLWNAVPSLNDLTTCSYQIIYRSVTLSSVYSSVCHLSVTRSTPWSGCNAIVAAPSSGQPRTDWCVVSTL